MLQVYNNIILPCFFFFNIKISNYVYTVLEFIVT